MINVWFISNSHTCNYVVCISHSYSLIQANNIYTSRPYSSRPRQPMENRHTKYRPAKLKMNGVTNISTTTTRLRKSTVGAMVPEEESDDDSAYPKPQKLEENCFTKCFQCLKGSAAYRTLQMELSPGGVNSGSRIDQASRVLFPAAFIGFHLFYWMTYLNTETMASMFIHKWMTCAQNDLTIKLRWLAHSNLFDMVS